MRIKIKKTGSYNSSKKYIDLIEKASVYDIAINSPITFAPNISQKEKNKIYLKREDLQPVFSFKNRGAYNKIVNLTPKQKDAGVIAASAGNHAQGVAVSCKKLKINCLIVMPITTPEIKVKAVKQHGAKVLLHGDNYDAAVKEAKKIAKSNDFAFVHPFDDKYTIAGQGTIGKEILESDQGYDVIFVPVGGGGLLAGVSAWISQKAKKVKLIGVEVEDSACLAEAVKANKRVRLKEVGLFADGVAVEQVGKNNFEVIKECVDEVITVSIDEVCAAVQDIFEDTYLKKIVLKGYGYNIKIPAMEPAYRSGNDGTNENVHNFFINIYARGGLIHLLLYLSFFIVLFKSAAQNNRLKSLAVVFIPLILTSFFDASMENAHYPLIFYFLIGKITYNQIK